MRAACTLTVALSHINSSKMCMHVCIGQLVTQLIVHRLLSRNCRSAAFSVIFVSLTILDNGIQRSFEVHSIISSEVKKFYTDFWPFLNTKCRLSFSHLLCDRCVIVGTWMTLLTSTDFTDQPWPADQLSVSITIFHPFAKTTRKKSGDSLFNRGLVQKRHKHNRLV